MKSCFHFWTFEKTILSPVYISLKLLPALFFYVFFYGVGFAASPKPEKFIDMDIEDLMAVEVTSMARYVQNLFDTPGAITVISKEDIQRSGLKEMSEILRLAPGIQVLRSNEATTFVSSRSMPIEGQRKMLVMVDGRSIFSQDTGTVNWEAQSFMIEDIDRIEVIRGPGATSWGYNAVDGVINIITQPPKKTQGVLLDLTQGSRNGKILQTRLGGAFSENAFYRVYFMGSWLDAFDNPDGPVLGNELTRRKSGFRIDLNPRQDHTLTLEAAVSETDYDQVGDYNDVLKEKFIKTDWTAWLGNDTSLKVLIHYDDNDKAYGTINNQDSFSIGIEEFYSDVQVDFYVGQRHHVVVGGGYKFTRFTPRDGYGITFHETRQQWNNYNGFVSDEISLIEDKFWLTLGVKVEHNTITKSGFHPSLRMLYKPAPDQRLWFSVSRALRPPDFRDAAPRTLFLDRWNEYHEYTIGPLKDEEMIAYEAGYRIRTNSGIDFELALFYNDYSRLLNLDAMQTGPQVWEVFNTYDNSITAYGTEFSVSWKPLDKFSLTGSYAYLYNEFVLNGLSWHSREDNDISRIQLHAHLDAADHISFDTHLYWNNAYRFFGTKIPDYLRLDLGITWALSDNAEISLFGQNLLDPGHKEMDSLFNGAYHAEIPRNLQLGMKFRF